VKSIDEITLDWVFARVVEQDGCLVWKDKCAKTTAGPNARIGGTLMSMRRVIWVLSRERAIPKKRRTVTSCGNPKCVHPDHLQALLNNETRRGIKPSINHRARIAQAKRANSTWTDEQIREVAESVGSVRQVAAQYGMSSAYVSNIRRNKSRVDFTNPYLQLGAR